MLDRAELEALLERVNTALDGADRELDADIAVALEGGEVVWRQTRYTGESFPALKRTSAAHVGGIAYEHCPLLTASVDAALALVGRCLPDAPDLDLCYDHIQGLWDFYINPYGTAEVCHLAERMKSAPLAILAALLKALIAEA